MTAPDRRRTDLAGEAEHGQPASRRIPSTVCTNAISWGAGYDRSATFARVGARSPGRMTARGVSRQQSADADTRCHRTQEAAGTDVHILLDSRAASDDN